MMGKRAATRGVNMQKREEGEPERKTQQKNIKRKTKQNKIFKASIIIIIIMVLLLLLMLNIIVFYKHLHIINALLYTSSLTFVQGHTCT